MYPGDGGRTTVLVAGGTGFVGSAVVALLVRCGVGVRVLRRRALPEWMTRAGVRWVSGDLADPDSLRGVADGADVLLHLAARVDRDPVACATVNVRGTSALLARARQAGVTRILYNSTCAVYGTGPHRGLTESEIVPAPASVASRTRLAAEAAVLAEGGVVLRPHLVFGQGDRWFVPALLRLLREVPATVDGGRARMSVVAVDDLARAIVGVAASGLTGVHHVNHPRPVTMRELLDRLGRHIGCRRPTRDIDRATHRELLREARFPLSDHQYALITDDHWYRSEQVWCAAGVSAGPGLAHRIAESASWYRARYEELLA